MNNNKIYYWIFFGFLLTVVPVFIAVVFIVGDGANADWWSAFKLAISKGELMLACVSLLGVNIGDLVQGSFVNDKHKPTFFGSTAILFLCAACFFVKINSDQNFNKDMAFHLSIVMLICTFTVCFVTQKLPRK